MPFYEALKFLMSTTNTKIKRIGWDNSYHLAKLYDYTCERYVINLINGNRATAYIPRPDDLTSKDWVIVE